ncbi:hypothetical protein [Actinomycetospora atypica]|uniref:Esterase-like activity of phytase family protein n=1 Tax=Actinomycetospora atypica TaxID=1290095 RepID=A0ABV9YND7_9PSEU
MILAVALTAALLVPTGDPAGCALSDPRLDEVSGLVVTPAGPVVVNDSGNATVLFTLAPDCSVAATRTVGVRGRDVEDLARTPDGVLWLADIGDNRGRRDDVALIRVPPSGAASVTRWTYPDGPHDAEALLMTADERPVIVTKELGGRSGVYVGDPAGDSGGVLRRAGEVTLPPSTTEGGPAGLFGRGLVTGGAVSPDGRSAALRTYSDAWVYPVAGPTADDLVAALLVTPGPGTPVQVPLPGEPQGEAVALTDGGTLLSAGESPSGSAPARLREVRVPAGGAPAAVAPSTVTGAPTAAASPGPTDPSGAGIAVAAGAVVVLAAVLGALTWARRRRR